MLAISLLAGFLPLYALCAPDTRAGQARHCAECPMTNMSRPPADPADKVELPAATPASLPPCCALNRSVPIRQTPALAPVAPTALNLQVSAIAGALPFALAISSPIAAAAPRPGSSGPPQAVLCTFLI